MKKIDVDGDKLLGLGVFVLMIASWFVGNKQQTKQIDKSVKEYLDKKN